MMHTHGHRTRHELNGCHQWLTSVVFLMDNMHGHNTHIHTRIVQNAMLSLYMTFR